MLLGVLLLVVEVIISHTFHSESLPMRHEGRHQQWGLPKDACKCLPQHFLLGGVVVVQVKQCVDILY